MDSDYLVVLVVLFVLVVLVLHLYLVLLVLRLYLVVLVLHLYLVVLVAHRYLVGMVLLDCMVVLGYSLYCLVCLEHLMIVADDSQRVLNLY